MYLLSRSIDNVGIDRLDIYHQNLVVVYKFRCYLPLRLQQKST